MIRLWGITDRGAVRRQNQDAYYISSSDPVVAIVCDGMGGARAGNVASELAVTAAAEYLAELDREDLLSDVDGHLVKAAELANQAVYLRALSDPGCAGMGTTMVAALAREDGATLLNIGDSRGYWMGEGEIRKITRDHSLVEDLVRRGQISPEEARFHPQKNLITRALGSEPSARVDLYHIPFQAGQFLLLCSDGLSNVVSDPELLETVTGGEPADTCCRRLLELTLSRGAPDNVTCVLISHS